MYLGRQDAAGGLSLCGRYYEPRKLLYADNILGRHGGGYPTGHCFVRGILLRIKNDAFLVGITQGPGSLAFMTKDLERNAAAAARRADDLAREIASGFRETGILKLGPEPPPLCHILRPRPWTTIRRARPRVRLRAA